MFCVLLLLMKLGTYDSICLFADTYKLIKPLYVSFLYRLGVKVISLL